VLKNVTVKPKEMLMIGTVWHSVWHLTEMINKATAFVACAKKNCSQKNILVN